MTLGPRVVADLRKRVTVLPFHADWITKTFEPSIEVSALSCPRGSAKSWIVGQLAGAGLCPGSPLWLAGIETLVVSGSLEQSRIVLGFVREALADVEDDYRWLDSGQRLACTHKATGTKLRVLSSSGKRAMGLVNYSTIYADEPAAWEVRGGALMWDALRTSLGKRGGQRLVLIGTRAPAEPDSWWPLYLMAAQDRERMSPSCRLPKMSPGTPGPRFGGRTPWRWRTRAYARPSCENVMMLGAIRRSAGCSRRTDSTGKLRFTGTC